MKLSFLLIAFAAAATTHHNKESDLKCAYENDDRLFRTQHAVTLDACKAQCADTSGCNFYSWGNSASSHPGICMGCEHGVQHSHTNFEFYSMEKVESQNQKCPYNSNNRLFRSEGKTVATCKQQCKDTPGCNFYSWGKPSSSHPQVCMGCDKGVFDYHAGFNQYKLESPTTCPVTCTLVGSHIKVTHNRVNMHGIDYDSQHRCYHADGQCSCECDSNPEPDMSDKGEKNCGTSHKKPCTTQWQPNGGCSKDTTLAHPFNGNSCWPCGDNNQLACKFKYSNNQGCGPDDTLAKGGDANKPHEIGEFHGYNTKNPNPHPAGKCWTCGGDNEPRCDNKYANNNGCKANHSGTHHANKCWACTRGNVKC